MENDKLLTRLKAELECRVMEQEVEPREEFTVLFRTLDAPDAPDAPDVPDAPVNPFEEPICPFIYW